MNSLKYPTVAALIPAYNEADRIGEVVGTVLASNVFQQIIVVDDASHDETAQKAQAVSSKINVIKLSKNLGKAGAVLTGLKEVQTENIFLFDADLHGLRARDIRHALACLEDGLDMVILNYGRQEWWLRHVVRSFPALSGVRVLKTKLLNQVIVDKDDRFALETRINDKAIEQNWRVGIVMENDIYTPHKFRKYPFPKGQYLELAAIINIVSSKGLLSAPKLIWSWLTLMSRARKIKPASYEFEG